MFCWKQRKTNLFCFRKEKCFLDGQSGSPLMFEVLYHSPKILGVSSLENKFARLWISTQKQFPPVPRSLCPSKITFLRVNPFALPKRKPSHLSPFPAKKSSFAPEKNISSSVDLSKKNLSPSSLEEICFMSWSLHQNHAKINTKNKN